MPHPGGAIGRRGTVKMLLHPLERCSTGLRVSTYRFESCLGQFSSALTTHLYNTASIRVVTIEGNPWFVAKDCLIAMGYSPDAVRMVLGKLGPDEQIVATRANDYRNLIAGLPRVPSLTFISESGLYKLIMRSDKPEAKAFQDWVTKEVLPSIRKHGGYPINENLQGFLFPQAASHQCSSTAGIVSLAQVCVGQGGMLQTLDGPISGIHAAHQVAVEFPRAKAPSVDVLCLGACTPDLESYQAELFALPSTRGNRLQHPQPQPHTVCSSHLPYWN